MDVRIIKMMYGSATGFIIATILAFFIPGDIFIRRLNLTKLQRIVLAVGLGMVLWALQGFIFGFLGFRDLTYVYLAICMILWLKRF